MNLPSGETTTCRGPSFSLGIWVSEREKGEMANIAVDDVHPYHVRSSVKKSQRGGRAGGVRIRTIRV